MSTKHPHSEPSSPEVSYRRCLVTFIDLLGFKKMIEAPLPAHEIASTLNLVRKHTRDDEDIGKLYNSAFFAFSDSLVRILPIDTEVNKRHPIGLPFFEILQMVHAQASLANRGIFIRGAMTIGNMHFDPETAFGPALVAAYQLESQTALYPRIIIDPALLLEVSTNLLLKKDVHTFDREKAYIKDMLRQDADGFWHIDYLHAMIDESDSEAHYFRFLKEHKKHIESNIKTENHSVFSKMGWLSSYHNEAVGNLSETALVEEGYSSADLRVEPVGPLWCNF